MKRLLLLSFLCVGSVGAQSFDLPPRVYASPSSSVSSKASVSSGSSVMSASSVPTNSAGHMTSSHASSVSSATFPSVPYSSSSSAMPAFSPTGNRVILYGQIDQGFGYTQQRITGQHQGVPFSIRQSNSGMRSGVMGDSKVGIRAEQDLGGGSRVFIQIEEGFNGSSGARSKERGTHVIGIGG